MGSIVGCWITPALTHFDGRARLLDAHTIEIGETRVTAEKILVATGSKPFVQDIPGQAFLSTSDDAFALEQLPKRVLVLGGGYIAVEFAGIFAGLGVETTLLIVVLSCFEGSMRIFAT